MGKDFCSIFYNHKLECFPCIKFSFKCKVANNALCTQPVSVSNQFYITRDLVIMHYQYNPSHGGEG